MEFAYEPWFTCPQCGYEGFTEDFFGDVYPAPCCLRCGTPYPGLTELVFDD
jgi:hypothetical protein